MKIPKQVRPKPQGFGGSSHDRFSGLIQASAIKTAGKKLNKNTATKLKDGVTALTMLAETIGSILADAGESEEVAAGVAPRIDPSRLRNELQAGQLADRVNRSSWYERMYAILRMFSYLFEEELYEQEDDMATEVEALIVEFGDLFRALASQYNETFVVAASKAAGILQAKSVPQDLIQLSTSIDLSQLSASNTIPIAGVLCTLNTPSENIPAVGPGMPLYISSEVAAAALMGVAGLPLDAHESLREHANESIVGVMLSGSIAGNEMRINGHLYPFNQPEMVAAIRSKQRTLGMSMNALAPGHPEMMNGQQVYVVDKLTLLGANILEADAATYSKTKIAAVAAPTPELTGLPVNPVRFAAAAAQTTPITPITPITQEPEMNAQEIIQAVGQAVALQLEPIVAQVTDLTATVNTLAQERQTQLDQANEVAAAAAKQQESDNLAAMIRTQTFDAMAKVMNPYGAPNRITQPLQASSATTEIAENPELMQLIASFSRAQGQLDALQASSSLSSGAGAQRVKLRDEVAQYRSQILRISPNHPIAIA